MRMDLEKAGDKETSLDLESEPENPFLPSRDLLEPLGHYEWTFRDHGRKKLVPPPEMMQRFSIQRNNSVFVECRIPQMTEDTARNALLSFVNSKCCYGNRAAGELIIQELKPQRLCRYRLETFNETRLCEWTFEAYTNTLVDGPQNGTSPRPWDIKVQVPQMFQDDTKKFRVPHSSLVKECHKCHGRGRYKCSGCHGAGRMRCVTCSGARHKAKAKYLQHQKRCQMCSGTGRKRCSTCSGRGNKTCTTCQGEKKLLHFVQLIITWKNNVYEFISEHELNFPRELLNKAKGENIFKDENIVVYPLVDFPYPQIVQASQRAIAEHNAIFTGMSRILQQRQTVELIPVTEVHYRYAQKMYLYYIYGMENKVYALDYPERYCCGCTII
ncbi:protein SSUH2 homolog [Anolis carolinensis]|uniref:protein SSUH2 homolog n=1 Tax=Anolis carolinensis TaxID=28377 RepID=UPI0004629F7E|nr:PREDICTED: protein SSUH2 homolog [Anolis carolinensis]|eukprot:XP_008117931.1 PREDICTED: protein SSUH2 homolog [Anolis carolinensis]